MLRFLELSECSAFHSSLAQSVKTERSQAEGIHAQTRAGERQKAIDPPHMESLKDIGRRKSIPQGIGRASRTSHIPAHAVSASIKGLSHGLR